MNLKKILQEKIILPCLSKLSRNVAQRILMMGTCLFGKGWRYLDFITFNDMDFQDLSENEIKKLYYELSDHSMNELLTFYKYVKLGKTFSQYFDTTKNSVLIVPFLQLFPGIENKIVEEEKICKKLQRQLSFDGLLAEVFCYHHGLKFLDNNVLDYIKDTVFLDLGAFIGDSAYVLSQYEPSKMLLFEPSEINRRLCLKHLNLEGIKNFELIPLGVSDQNQTLWINERDESTFLKESGSSKIEVVTIDSFLKQHKYGKIGLIKADLEGMAFKMVNGAIDTIKRDRPIMLISIYHNQEEFMGVYRILRENLRDYHYKVHNLRSFLETTLIAWPKEAE